MTASIGTASIGRRRGARSRISEIAAARDARRDQQSAAVSERLATYPPVMTQPSRAEVLSRLAVIREAHRAMHELGWDAEPGILQPHDRKSAFDALSAALIP